MSNSASRNSAAKSYTDTTVDNDNPEDGLKNESFDTHVNELLQAAVVSTRLSNALPSGKGGTTLSDYAFQSSFPGFKKRAVTTGKLALRLLNRIINHVNEEKLEKYQGHRKRQKNDLMMNNLEDAIEADFFDNVVDTVDDLLERADNMLDPKYVKKRKSFGISSGGINRNESDDPRSFNNEKRLKENDNDKNNQNQVSHKSYFPMDVLNIAKPQDSFKRKINNFEDERNTEEKQYMQSMTKKIKNLHYDYDTNGSVFNSSLLQCHQTEKELFLLRNLSDKDDEYFSNIFVSTKEELDNAILTLNMDLKNQGKEAQVIAVDLEAHTIRSYQGFICLIQISTAFHDFLIDAIELRHYIFDALHPIFQDSNIVKVFHGATSDIQWLQRDFNLFVVNLFDTFRACKILSFPYKSLAFLLKHYCQFIADKKYQRADWRQRPLPIEMLRYAASDTFFLLYIFLRMKQDLLIKADGKPDLLQQVFEESKCTSEILYTFPTFDPQGYEVLLEKAGLRSILQQDSLNSIKTLYSWRDMIARTHDESNHYILPNHSLIALARSLPSNWNDAQITLRRIPPIFLSNPEYRTAIVEIIQNEKENSQIKSDNQDLTEQLITDSSSSQKNNKNIKQQNEEHMHLATTNKCHYLEDEFSIFALVGWSTCDSTSLPINLREDKMNIKTMEEGPGYQNSASYLSQNNANSHSNDKRNINTLTGMGHLGESIHIVDGFVEEEKTTIDGNMKKCQDIEEDVLLSTYCQAYPQSFYTEGDAKRNGVYAESRIRKEPPPHEFEPSELDHDTIPSLPSSMSEIYNISKKRKKNHSSGHMMQGASANKLDSEEKEMTEEDTPVTQISSNAEQLVSQYLNEAKKSNENTSMDSFVSSLGWEKKPELSSSQPKIEKGNSSISKTKLRKNPYAAVSNANIGALGNLEKEKHNTVLNNNSRSNSKGAYNPFIKGGGKGNRNSGTRGRGR